MNKPEVPARKKANLSCQLVAVTMPPRRTHTLVVSRGDESISVDVDPKLKERNQNTAKRGRSSALSPFNSPHQPAKQD